ncbi:MAG: type II toxin-antitoxin system HicA family toxin [Acidobacteria bacterium]|nr:type II toxin-antitoxin system HicA family toxin [Acidobacteriota bacterium]
MPYEISASFGQTSSLGFNQIRKGSHVKMKHADGRLIVFPFHD